MRTNTAIQPLNALALEVADPSVLDVLSSRFDVFTRSDLRSEIILDCTFLENNEECKQQLFKVLGIQKASDMANEIALCGYVVFYC